MNQREHKQLLQKFIYTLDDLFKSSQNLPYNRLLKFLLDICHANFGSLNLYDQTHRHFITVAISIPLELHEKCITTPGFSLVNNKWKPNEEFISDLEHSETSITYKQLIQAQKNNELYNYFFSIEKLFQTKSIHILKIFVNQVLIGFYTIGFEANKIFKNKPYAIIYSYLNAALIYNNLSKKFNNSATDLFIENVTKELQKYLEINAFLLNALNLTLLFIDRKGLILGYHINKKQIDSYEKFDVNKKIEEVLPPEIADKIIFKLNALFESNETQIFNFCPKMHSEIKTLEFRLVRLNDEIACGLITDLSDYFNLRLSLQQQNKLLRLIVDNITSLLILPVESGNSDTIINNLLGIIGQHIEADRVYYFKYYWNEGYTKNTHEWCNIGIKPEIENLQHVQLNLIPEWASAHDKGRTIFISDTMNLPDCPLRDLLLSQNIKSLIAVPAMLGKKCVGFVGFDFVNNYHNAPKEEEIILLTLARAIANFEHRREIYNTLVEYNAKIEESERLKSAILANFSHEIRTPLNGIIGSAELIMNEAIDIKELKEYTLCILESSYRLLEFLSNVIDLSQVESGIKGIHLEKVKLSEIIESVQVQFSSKAAKKNLILKTTLSDDLKNLLLHTDSEKIQRILYNVVENGIKFTEKGYVELSCHVEEDEINFIVKDTGKGIAPEQLNRIFEPFYQTDYALNRGWEGAGIGLAVAKNFAKLLGGSIEVVSQVGKGSTFTIKIPLRTNKK